MRFCAIAHFQCIGIHSVLCKLHNAYADKTPATASAYGCSVCVCACALLAHAHQPIWIATVTLPVPLRSFHPLHSPHASRLLSVVVVFASSFGPRSLCFGPLFTHGRQRNSVGRHSFLCIKIYVQFLCYAHSVFLICLCLDSFNDTNHLLFDVMIFRSWLMPTTWFTLLFFSTDKHYSLTFLFSFFRLLHYPMNGFKLCRQNRDVFRIKWELIDFLAFEATTKLEEIHNCIVENGRHRRTKLTQ